MKFALSDAQFYTSVAVIVAGFVFLEATRKGLIPHYSQWSLPTFESPQEVSQEDLTRKFLESNGVTEDLFDMDLDVRAPILDQRTQEFGDKTIVQPGFEKHTRREIENFFRLKIREFEQALNLKKMLAYRLKEELSQSYLFPKFVRIDPGKVGDEVEIQLVEGKTHKRITKAVNPPIFEIPDFLSEEECNFILEKATSTNLTPSSLFGGNLKKSTEDGEEGREKADIVRISYQTWLTSSILGPTFSRTIRSRVAKLTQLPYEVMIGNEPIQVVYYEPGGHYHGHTDSSGEPPLPCCNQKMCGAVENTAAWSECCRMCRYATVLYYLNDVEDGGETAFPLADAPDDVLEAQMKLLKNNTWTNLSKNCHNSSVVVKPQRGKAVFWYNMFLGDDGYLGRTDNRSHHGGCDIRQGVKWVANTWISGSSYEDRHKRSTFYGVV